MSILQSDPADTGEILTPEHRQDDGSWRQLDIHFDNPATAEVDFAEHVVPTLQVYQANGAITSWWFIRKTCWRLRYRPTRSPAHTPSEDVGQNIEAVLDNELEEGRITSWHHGIYEPETHAFGGQTGIGIAHDLFHADSANIAQRITHGGSPGLRNHRRELSLLLCSAFLRAAGQDRYEQGDVWAKVAAHRPTIIDHDTSSLADLVERLVTTDTVPTTMLRRNELRHIDDWLTAFEHAGRRLCNVAASGRLQRGIRAVSAHQIIFHWNRLGLTARTQAILARTAADLIFNGSSRRRTPLSPPGHASLL